MQVQETRATGTGQHKTETDKSSRTISRSAAGRQLTNCGPHGGGMHQLTEACVTVRLAAVIRRNARAGARLTADHRLKPGRMPVQLSKWVMSSQVTYDATAATTTTQQLISDDIHWD